ncbi:MAG TPA: hypothetical protein VK737_12435 [Opitutales bacterium]|jgi:hypothetical protein|nr:hypothetical protein [Opitutales bacterium]
MRENTPIWLRLLPLMLCLLLLTGAAGAALTVVHLREEEARLASSILAIEGKIKSTDRQTQEMTAAVASAQQPDALRARIGNLLAPMTEKQIVWVNPGVGVPPVEALRPPVAANFDNSRLATLDTASSPNLFR